MDKKELRQMMHEKRKNLTPQQVSTFSVEIIRKLIALPILAESKFVMSYMPYGNEVDIMPLNRWLLEKGKHLCIPRVLNPAEMDAVQINSLGKDLIKSGFGISEPSKECDHVDISKIELILVPGVAFDRQRNRMGHGRGYYDRFIEKCENNIFTIGIAYGFQVLNNIPYDLHDKKMNVIVTEKEII